MRRLNSQSPTSTPRAHHGIASSYHGRVDRDDDLPVPPNTTTPRSPSLRTSATAGIGSGRSFSFDDRALGVDRSERGGGGPLHPSPSPSPSPSASTAAAAAAVIGIGIGTPTNLRSLSPYRTRPSTPGGGVAQQASRRLFSNPASTPTSALSPLSSFDGFAGQSMNRRCPCRKLVVRMVLLPLLCVGLLSLSMGAGRVVRLRTDAAATMKTVDAGRGGAATSASVRGSAGTDGGANNARVRVGGGVGGGGGLHTGESPSSEGARDESDLIGPTKLSGDDGKDKRKLEDGWDIPAEGGALGSEGGDGDPNASDEPSQDGSKDDGDGNVGMSEREAFQSVLDRALRSRDLCGGVNNGDKSHRRRRRNRRLGAGSRKKKHRRLAAERTSTVVGGGGGERQFADDNKQGEIHADAAEGAPALAPFGIIRAISRHINGTSPQLHNGVETATAKASCRVTPSTSCRTTNYTVVLTFGAASSASSAWRDANGNRPRLLRTLFMNSFRLLAPPHSASDIIILYPGATTSELESDRDYGRRLLSWNSDPDHPVRLVLMGSSYHPSGGLSRFHPKLEPRSEAVLYVSGDVPLTFSPGGIEAGFDLWRRNSASLVRVQDGGVVEQRHSGPPGDSSSRILTGLSMSARFVEQCPDHGETRATTASQIVSFSPMFLHRNYLCFFFHPVFADLRQFVGALATFNPSSVVGGEVVAVSAIVSQLSGTLPRLFPPIVHRKSTEETPAILAVPKHRPGRQPEERRHLLSNATSAAGGGNGIVVLNPATMADADRAPEPQMRVLVEDGDRSSAPSLGDTVLEYFGSTYTGFAKEEAQSRRTKGCRGRAYAINQSIEPLI